MAPQEDQLHQLARLVDVDGNGRVNIWQFTAAFVAHDSGTHTTSSAGSDDSDFAGARGFREDMGPEETARKALEEMHAQGAVDEGAPPPSEGVPLG